MIEVGSNAHDFITQEAQPVVYAAAAQAATQTRRIAGTRGGRAQAPEARGPEAQHDELALGHEHPIRFAQHGVGIRGVFEGMGQEHRIHGPAING